jgi:hypothetical protein
MITTANDFMAAWSPMAGYTQKTLPSSTPEAPARAAAEREGGSVDAVHVHADEARHLASWKVARIALPRRVFLDEQVRAEDEGDGGHAGEDADGDTWMGPSTMGIGENGWRIVLGEGSHTG